MAERNILIVDDEETIRELFSHVLTDAGYSVETAESAEAALELLKDKKIKVMFFDLNLPGMNGVELCQEVRKERPIAVIYAVTGYPSVFELLGCREAGFDDYFKKPVKLDVIKKAADDAFDKIDRWSRG